MPIVPLFLFKLSLSLAVVWCFYQVVLRRLTFYSLNRWYLLGYTVLSFIIPLVNIGPMLPDGPAGEPTVIRFIPAIGGVSRVATAVATSHESAFPVWTMIVCVVATGSVLLSVRLAVRWMSLIRLRRRARRIEGMGMKIYQVDGPIIPFSFGKAIYVNQLLHTGKEWEDIVLHEYVHIRQRHTVDILIAELVCIINWYNPFAWLIRYSVRQNLEFIADQQVLDKGVDRKGYQYHLLMVVGEPRYRLANNFNFSSLKRRIIMMNRMRSAKVHLLKLLFLLPLVAVLLAAFRDRGMRLFGSHGPVYVNAAGIVITSPDRKPLEGVLVRDQVTGLAAMTDANGYYKIRIPVSGNPVKIHLDYSKLGYDSDMRGRGIPEVKESIGVLDIAVLHLLTVKRPVENGFAFGPGFEKVPVDPDYADAIKELHRALQESDNLNRYMKLLKDHPEIGLFFTTEDGRKEIVIYLDGTIERYGYPGTPGLPQLYKKYGQIEGFMASDHPSRPVGNSGYLARWAAIGEQAQQEFRTTNPNVRSVLFPGDSRVIVVPVSGKPKVYDMDNDASVERTEFERLYGKLPDCVPKAGNNTDAIARKTELPPAGRKDTIPAARDTTRQHILVTKDSEYDGSKEKKLENSAVRPAGRVTLVGGPNGPIFLINGREIPEDTLQKINPDSISRIDVLKDTQNVNSPFFKKYGDKVRNGVVIIHMKSEKAPYCLVEGREVSWDSMQRINPGEIESMNFLKPEEARAKYGEKAKNGAVLVALKPKGAGAGNR